MIRHHSLPDTVVKAESVNSSSWIDSGMIRKSNIIGKLTQKVPEAKEMYKFNLITLKFYTALCYYTGHRGN